MRQEAKNIPLSHSEIGFSYIRLGLYSRAQTFHKLSEEKEDYSACMLRQ